MVGRYKTDLPPQGTVGYPKRGKCGYTDYGVDCSGRGCGRGGLESDLVGLEHQRRGGPNTVHVLVAAHWPKV